jgi:hypothetical protein
MTTPLAWICCFCLWGQKVSAIVLLFQMQTLAGRSGVRPELLPSQTSAFPASGSSPITYNISQSCTLSSETGGNVTWVDKEGAGREKVPFPHLGNWDLGKWQRRQDLEVVSL